MQSGICSKHARISTRALPEPGLLLPLLALMATPVGACESDRTEVSGIFAPGVADQRRTDFGDTQSFAPACHATFRARPVWPMQDRDRLFPICAPCKRPDKDIAAVLDDCFDRSSQAKTGPLAKHLIKRCPHRHMSVNHALHPQSHVPAHQEEQSGRLMSHPFGPQAST